MLIDFQRHSELCHTVVTPFSLVLDYVEGERTAAWRHEPLGLNRLPGMDILV
jgi:hypothetical protein